MKRMTLLALGIAGAGTAWAMVFATHAAESVAPTTWQAAVGTLQDARARGESCAGVLKAHGQPDDVVEGRLAYSSARAGFNEYIDEMLVLLEAGDKIESAAPNGLDHGSASLDQLCTMAHETLGEGDGSKSVVLEIFKGVGGDFAEAIVDETSELVRAWAQSGRLQQKRITQRIEDQKWLPFEDVEPTP